MKCSVMYWTNLRGCKNKMVSCASCDSQMSNPYSNWLKNVYFMASINQKLCYKASSAQGVKIVIISSSQALTSSNNLIWLVLLHLVASFKKVKIQCLCLSPHLCLQWNASCMNTDPKKKKKIVFFQIRQKNEKHMLNKLLTRIWQSLVWINESCWQKYTYLEWQGTTMFMGLVYDSFLKLYKMSDAEIGIKPCCHISKISFDNVLSLCV